MKLDDLNRPRLRYRIRWWTLAVGLVSALLYASYAERKNVYLTRAVSEQAHYIAVTLDSLEVEVSVLRGSRAEIMAALERGGPRAVEELLRRADK